jgi:ABC-type cobalt transport system substrate-binding protein
MTKLAKLILVIVVVAVAAYVLVSMRGRFGGSERAATDRPDERPRLEEKYGFTSETVGD